MKQLNQSSDVKVVDDPDAARFLLDGAQQKLLHPFLDREATIGQAAKELGVSTSMLFHRVKRWLGLGLIEVVREEPRSGRALQYYKSTNAEFFIPVEMTRSGLVEDVLRDARQYHDRLLTANIAATLMQQEGLGIVVLRGDSGVVETQLALGPDAQMPMAAPEVFDFFMPTLKLDRGDVGAFRDELIGLLERYAQKNGRDDYLLHIGFAPLKIDRLP